MAPTQIDNWRCSVKQKSILWNCLLLIFPLFIVGGGPLRAQCQYGLAAFDTIPCSTTSICSGFVVIDPKLPTSALSPAPFPCGCVLLPGCPQDARVKAYVDAHKNETFSSRPMFFVGCNGSIIWALTAGRETVAHAS